MKGVKGSLQICFHNEVIMEVQVSMSDRRSTVQRNLHSLCGDIMSGLRLQEFFAFTKYPFVSYIISIQ